MLKDCRWIGVLPFAEVSDEIDTPPLAAATAIISELPAESVIFVASVVPDTFASSFTTSWRKSIATADPHIGERREAVAAVLLLRGRRGLQALGSQGIEVEDDLRVQRVVLVVGVELVLGVGDPLAPGV